MVINNIGNNAGVFMILSCKKNLASMNDRVPVSESIDMPVKNYAPPYLIGILEIVLAFYIVAYVIANDYFIGITGKVYVGQHIHFVT